VTVVTARFKDLCLDASDHQMLASWWCDVLGYERRVEPDWERPAEWPVPILDPTGAGPHIDVFGEVNRIVALGARVVLPRGDDRDWNVLADPEGNEFCVFDPPEPD
jgi:hypothetical protein